MCNSELEKGILVALGTVIINILVGKMELSFFFLNCEIH